MVNILYSYLLLSAATNLGSLASPIPNIRLTGPLQSISAPSSLLVDFFIFVN